MMVSCFPDHANGTPFKSTDFMPTTCERKACDKKSEGSAHASIYARFHRVFQHPPLDKAGVISDEHNASVFPILLSADYSSLASNSASFRSNNLCSNGLEKTASTS